MASPTETLDVYIAGFQIGTLSQLPASKLEFSYDDAWREGNVRIPLSLSMPPISQTHAGRAVEAFLWGLLPDNEQTLARWARRFQVSPRNPFALLKHVGRDCAGAVQFVTPGEPVGAQDDDVELLTEAEIGARLRELRQDGAAARRIGDPGQFSLAGAQAKTAFHYDEHSGRWGIPRGDTPTTHIFKPPMPHLAGHTENEHFCLRLASMMGLNAVSSQVLEFAGEKAIVVKRYDRRHVGGRTIRIHQEDMCQALSVMPTIKYENQGGPGVTRISNEVLPASMTLLEDRQAFMAANVFNFVIGGTDAHAKNYSMLLGAQGEARLAPLYDISSILPHLGESGIRAEMREIKLAMRIDRTYLIEQIMPRHWERASTAARVSPEFTQKVLHTQIASVSDMASDCAAGLRAEGIKHEVIAGLVDQLAVRATALRRKYGSTAD
jgi:serine/threonine-protein kinase HipA